MKREYKDRPPSNYSKDFATLIAFFVGFLKVLRSWKGHTLEKSDRSNLSVLNKLEKDIKLREKFESVNPALKPYFWGKDAIIESGIYALLKLVTYNKSANSCSFAGEFDYIVERKVKVKHMSLYH